MVCFGNVGCSPFLLGFCGERDVTVSFLSEYGRFLARVVGPVSGNVLLRREQYRKADDDFWSAEIGRACIIGKIANCRSVLRRALRDHGEKLDAPALKEVVNHLSATLNSLQRRESDLDQLRGIEGDAAHSYFSVFDHLLVRNKSDFIFRERNRRPPLDRVNCLLSFLYTLLMHDIRSALECTGLDPAVGFLHRDRPGRLSLALDLMEEFRPLADRLALSLVNRGQLQGRDFKISESGAIRMKDEPRKKILNAWQSRKQDVLEHPYIKKKMPIGLLFHTQALLLARFLRGDLDGYPPMIWR
ncbi:MAG: subtype I-C CRISPR-associated endonuclease Cas1 [Desulfobulbus propionicus]|nr:MAG: subtype I-C CRISPR-associated endonuclease Cas1 [Desulfobulbus propionicus]